MSWVLFSILAALIWAIVNIIDKFILDKWVKNPTTLLIIVGIFGFITSFFVYIFHGFSKLSNINIILAFIGGSVYILSIFLYLKSVKIEEISRIIPLWNLVPLFTLILATIFLGEIFAFPQYIGIFLLVTGAVLISVKRSLKLSFEKSFFLMICAAFCLSISNVIMKYLLNFADFWTVFAYIRMGAVFPLVFIIYFNLKELRKSIKKHGKKVLGIMSLAEILNIIALIFMTIAASVGFISLVGALTAVQPFFVLLFAIILSIFYPKIIKEEISKSTILIKITATFLMFLGIILIT